MADSSVDHIANDLELQFERLLSSSPLNTRTSTIKRMSASPDTSPMLHRTIEPSHPTILELDVAGRGFKVSADVLTTSSGWFRRQLSARFNWVPQRDGTYFVDADPVLFEHLLAFMRRPSVFPVLYSKTNGFDYALYNRLEVEAKHFEIDALYQWIKKTKYLDTVQIRTRVSMSQEMDQQKAVQFTTNATEKTKMIEGVRKVYLCPRQVYVHRGRPASCGRACREAQEGAPAQYDEEPYVRVVSMKHEVIFNKEACCLSEGVASLL